MRDLSGFELQAADDAPALDRDQLRVAASVGRPGGVEQRPVRLVESQAEQVRLLASVNCCEAERPTGKSEARVQLSRRRVGERDTEVANCGRSGPAAIQGRDVSAVDDDVDIANTAADVPPRPIRVSHPAAEGPPGP